MNNPFARPLYMMAKPVGAVCNLSCHYCYYLEKSGLYGERMSGFMSRSTLDRFVKSYIEAQTSDYVCFTWHGGEPSLMPLDFYKEVIRFQREYAGGKHIDNCFQTNGTLLDAGWCRFFKENNWLVGVSIDGPQELHDTYRRYKSGGPTFSKVMDGISLLEKYEVEWNAMAVVNNLTAEMPIEFYHFFKGIGCRYLQFTPVVERVESVKGNRLAVPNNKNARLTSWSVSPERWGYFLCSLFDDWVRYDVGEYFVQLFDSVLANWAGLEPGLCSMSRTCGHAGVIEANGDVYSCDHFVFPEYRIGNMLENTVTEMMYGDRQTAFGRAKQDSLTGQCRRCRFLFACNGECPKNRFALSVDGEYGLNYLCRGYYEFFKHVAPYMEFMKTEILSGREAANIMNHIDELKINDDE